LSNKGSSDANSAAQASSREQMDFQREMSNTSYQRAVDDMKKAGLSPMLAYSQGGASTPTGSMYNPKNELAGAANSAGSAVQASLNAALSKAQVEKTEAETELASAQAAEAAARIPTYQSTMDVNQSTITKASYETQEMLSRTNLNNVQQAKVYEEIKNLFEQRHLTSAQIGEALARTDLSREQIKEIAPRIMETYARTKKTDVETQTGINLLPFSELKGEWSDRLNLPKIIRDSQQTTNSAGSLGGDIYDFLHPSAEERNKRRINPYTGKDYR